jgi:hypothetical protein
MGCESDLQRTPPIFTPGEEVVADSAAGFLSSSDGFGVLHQRSGSNLAIYVSSQVTHRDAMVSANGACRFNPPSGHVGSIASSCPDGVWTSGDGFIFPRVEAAVRKHVD